MNKVILMGRLTRDPEISYSNKGDSQLAVGRFSLAVNRRFKRDGEPDADFFNCTAFGKTAEFVEKYLHKGTKVVTVGRIQNDNYTNRDGEKVYGIRIMVEEIEFAGSKNADVQGNGCQQMPVDCPNPDDADGFIPVADDLKERLPFN